MSVDGRLVRVVGRAGVADVSAFMASTAAQMFTKSGRLVRSDILAAPEIGELFAGIDFKHFDRDDVGMVLEHERVPFPTFPYEWPPEMLYEAGRLTLDLAEGLLSEGLGLKDATPYNVLFRGPEPMFVDVLSAERRKPGDLRWLPYAQFVRTFLMPLLINKRFGIPLDQVFMTHRDGLDPEEVYELCGPIRKLLPPWLTLVSIPTWLGALSRRHEASIYRENTGMDPDKGVFVLRSLFKTLRRALDGLAPGDRRRSTWSDYTPSDSHYTQEQWALKRTFVEEVVAEFRPRSVLDIGCNRGDFSVLAARRCARVVAVDRDPVVAGGVWRCARAEGLDVLPVVMDITRPSPAVGWRNQEHPAFLDRARGAFDAVLMLAIIHHMLVSESIPLAEIIDLASELTSDLLVIEFVAPNDVMFGRLARGRDDLFEGLTREAFEAICRRHFEIIRLQHLHQATRSLYLMRKRHPADA